MPYKNLADAELMQLSIEMKRNPEQQTFHDYVQVVRDYVDGRDPIVIPVSHKGLQVGENHEGGHRLNVRIKQAAAWLANGQRQFSVTPGSSEFHNQGEQMERFARYGEAKLSRGRQLHKWRMELSRDLFEGGLSIRQTNSTRGFYIRATEDRTLMTRGARLTDIIWNRRVDPLWAWWEEGNDGDVDAFLLEGNRRISNLAKVINAELYDRVRNTFAWAESLPDNRVSFNGENVKVDELWTADEGMLIYSGTESKGRGSKMKPDDPRRIIARWRNLSPRVPFYFTAATTMPYHSPLDEMIALTAERNYWATMLDHQASGAIFRSWQLVDTNTGAEIAPQLWSNPVPETVLLDLSKAPPNMGPGTEWKLAPFEMNDVLPRYQQIVMQHEAAGASVARLMGDAINGNSAVGTADMMEDYAVREMSDIIAAEADTTALVWHDIFQHIAKYHTKEPVIVAARLRDPADMKFKQTHLELRGNDVVAEDVEAKLDMRSRLAKNADYLYGREARTNGDMSFDRATELGYIPGVDDAEEEKADIYSDQIENITLETNAMAHQQQVAQSLGIGQGPAAPPAPANITRGNRTDPRGSGVGAGADNLAGSSVAPMARDAGARVA